MSNRALIGEVNMFGVETMRRTEPMTTTGAVVVEKDMQDARQIAKHYRLLAEHAKSSPMVKRGEPDEMAERWERNAELLEKAYGKG